MLRIDFDEPDDSLEEMSWDKWRDGRTFTYTYDFLNRVSSKLVPTGCVAGYACTTPPASAVRSIYYGYDAWGRQLSARFDSTTGADGVFSNYDGFGRLTSTTTAMSGTSRTVSCPTGSCYDADGDLKRLTWPNGQYVTYNYDGLDRATSFQENGSATIATFSYNAKSELQSGARGAVATTYGYDLISRPTSLGYDMVGTSGDVTLTLSYNPAHQILSLGRSNAAYEPTSAVSTQAYAPNGLNQYASVGGRPSPTTPTAT